MGSIFTLNFLVLHDLIQARIPSKFVSLPIDQMIEYFRLAHLHFNHFFALTGEKCPLSAREIVHSSLVHDGLDPSRVAQTASKQGLS